MEGRQGEVGRSKRRSEIERIEPATWLNAKVESAHDLGETRAHVRQVFRCERIWRTLAKELLGEHGLKVLEFFPIMPEGRQRIKSWNQLESDLLLEFRRTFGELPRCNKRLEGKSLSGLFSQVRLRRIIERYS